MCVVWSCFTAGQWWCIASTLPVIMAPDGFVICNHSCPHSSQAMIKSRRADALKLCYIFPYPPSAGIKSHVHNISFHPLCDDACQARNGDKFVHIGLDDKELQYWLPTLLSQTICPPGYEQYKTLPCSKSPVPGSWTEEFIGKEQEGE